MKNEMNLITLIQFCYHNGITLIIGATTLKINGIYNRFTCTITVNWSLPIRNQVNVILHEIGHWSLHSQKQKNHGEHEATDEGNRIAHMLNIKEGEKSLGAWRVIR